MRALPVLFCCALALAISSAARADGFTLESASFGSNTTLGTTQVYNKGDCHGGNVSPELHWSGAHADTKSFAVTLFDPDARDGAGWWHWLLFDINAKTKSLPAGAGGDVGSNASPGSISGSVIVTNRSNGRAPNVRAAASSPGSTVSNEIRIDLTMRGKAITAVASAAPAVVKAS